MQLTNDPRACGRQSGFTLIDILVATSLSVVALATFAKFHELQLFALRSQATQSNLQMSVRNVLDLFTREVRRAGANPTCVGGISPIADAKQHLLQIQSDLDADGAVTGVDEVITYQYKFDLHRFERVANGNVEPLLEGVELSGSRIRYFDGADVEITAGSTGLSGAQRNNVRRIRLELVASQQSPHPYDSKPARVAVANDIDLRNRYFANAVACP